MKIVVPVKQVAVVDEDFELAGDGTGVDPDFLEWSLNEWDEFSVEAALQLGDEVVVVTVGDEEATEGLLACLAKGADRAVRIWEDSLAGADALAVARVLAAAVGRESPDLVLCGVQSSDAVNSATGIGLAGFLDMPHVAVARAIAHEGGSLTVERELEGGLVEVVRIGLPALLTVQTGINEPRYANLRAIKQAREKPMEELDLAGLGLSSPDIEAASGSRLRKLAVPEAGEGAEMLQGSPADVATRIREIVADRLSA
ncbi:MAG TPA: electron transfer flavoprotein subunit beta/FixA family protein [Thermoleophilaceae bacterium]|jgi:electron transfer flavoprotein beta subunit